MIRCSAGRDGIEDVAAVELAAGDQVQRGDEEADPAGDEHRMGRDAIKGGNVGIPMD